jgi:hypothetical protein
MSHFAKVENGIVVNVIVAGQSFIDLLPDVDNWIQTSYNTRGGIHYEPNSNTPSADQSKALRKNYAGLGYTYDSRLDTFIPPKIFASWGLNEETCLWEAPVPMPQDGKSYRWNEELTQWEEIKV